MTEEEYNIKERAKHSQYLSSGILKPIHKFNGGIGATLCHECSVIIDEGFLKDLLCEDCMTKLKLKKDKKTNQYRKMTTREKISADLNELKSVRNSEAKELLKVVIGEIERLPNKNPNEDDVVKIIRKMKQNAIECNNTSEVKILDVYLPQMLSSVEMKRLVKQLIDNNNFTTMRDLGSVMKLINASPYANLIDKKEAVNYVKELLN